MVVDLARALLIGVDLYADPRVPSLAGCKADVADMADLLTGTLGFPADGIRTVVDHEATQAVVLAGIGGLFHDAADGAPRVLYFASHGSNALDMSGDEGPGDDLDELIVPHDWDPGQPAATGILDDAIHDQLAALSDRAVVTCIFDLCHSGTMTRGRSSGQRRFVPSAIPAAKSAIEMMPKRPHPVSLTGIRADVVSLSACGPLQSAHEILDHAGRTRGALTYCLGGVVRQRHRMACRETLEWVDRDLTEQRIRQSPEAEASRRRRVGGFFGAWR